jgi:MFS family permease
VKAAPREARSRFADLLRFARGPGGVSSDERRLLAVLGFSFLVNQYDMALIGLALPQLQAGLGVAEAEAGPLVGAVRLGAAGALVFVLAADGTGRRALLLATILGFTVFTALTAFARTPAEFVALQFGARACITAEEVLAIVVVVEELGARARGWGLGILAVFGALGHGLAALAYGFVEMVPFGWRALYAAGVLPLLCLAWIRRGLRETRRFEAVRSARGARGFFLPVGDLVGAYPGRLAALVAAMLSFGFVSGTALSFVSKTLQEVHRYAPHEVTLLVIGGGALAIASYPVAGALSDRFGRRSVLVAGLAAHALGVVAFYGASGAAVVAAWIGMMFGFMACDVLFGALGSELFPTSHRATASGVRMLVLGAGGALGLFFEGRLHAELGSHAEAIAWMAPTLLVAALVVVFALPETALRELEEIAPERGPRPAGTGGTP